MTAVRLNAPTPMTRVLLVDDDAELAELVGEYLAREGFSLDAETDGARAVDRAASGDYQLTVLDVMLPGVSGFDVLRALRATSRIPVLMLTARGDDVDRIVGLELGADDYLSKPFNPRELVARMRAILRRANLRAGRGATPDELAVGRIVLNTGMHQVRVAEVPAALTGAEFRVLELLMRSVGQVISREALTEQALGRTLVPYDRSIDTHISNLRRKLDLV